jgi:hypothetical protein
MAREEWPTSDEVRQLLRKLDEAVRDAETIRGHVERQMRRSAMFPDRRRPRHWDKNSQPDSDTAGS